MNTLKTGEGILGLKHLLRNVTFESYQVTIDDTEAIEHYYMTQALLDEQICKLMGWKYE